MIIKLFSTALVVFNNLLSSNYILNTVSSCDTVNSKFLYLNGTLAPDVPLLNENFTITVTYLNDYQIITSGTIDYNINFNGLPYTYSETLCSTNVPCPIELGNHVVVSNPISLSQTGTFKITTKWYSDTMDPLLCTSTIIKIPLIESPVDNTSQRMLRGNTQNYSHH